MVDYGRQTIFCMEYKASWGQLALYLHVSLEDIKCSWVTLVCMQTVFLMPIEIALQPKFNAKLPHPTLCMLQLKFFVVPYVTAAIYRIPVYFGNELFIQKMLQNSFRKKYPWKWPTWTHNGVAQQHFCENNFCEAQNSQKNLNKLLYGNWDAWIPSITTSFLY